MEYLLDMKLEEVKNQIQLMFKNKKYGMRLKQRLFRSNINQAPILIIANRRGGSTWIAESIANQKGVWYVNEPFAVLPSHQNYELKKSYLPVKEHSQYFHLDTKELDLFNNYLSLLFSADIRPLGYCKNPVFPFVINRSLLKILNAPWMLEWFLTQTNAMVMFLLRHPGAQAVSVLQQEWDFGVKAYFNRLDTLHDIFSNEQVKAGLDIIYHGDRWDMAILDWIITTHHGRTVKHGSLIKLSYEEVLLNQPAYMNNVLVEKLGFSDIENARKSLRNPSGSSRMCERSTIHQIKDNNIDYLVTKWRNHVSKKQLIRASEILEIFGVGTYSMYEPMPLIPYSSFYNEEVAL